MRVGMRKAIRLRKRRGPRFVHFGLTIAEARGLQKICEASKSTAVSSRQRDYIKAKVTLAAMEEEREY